MGGDSEALLFCEDIPLGVAGDVTQTLPLCRHLSRCFGSSVNGERFLVSQQNSQRETSRFVVITCNFTIAPLRRFVINEFIFVYLAELFW